MSISSNISPVSERVFFVVSRHCDDNKIIRVKLINLKEMASDTSLAQKLEYYIGTRRLGYIDEFNKVHLDAVRVKQLDNVISVVLKGKNEQFLSRSTIVQAIDEKEYTQFISLIIQHGKEISCVKQNEVQLIQHIFSASYKYLSVQFTLEMHKIVNRALSQFAENIRENEQRKEDEYQRSLINEMYKLSEILTKYLKQWNLKQDFIKARL